jgi:ABC-type nickel/cobalt efflux system permease component RcnA
MTNYGIRENRSARPPVRRLRFAIVVIVSQLLMIAMAVAWTVHMVIIAANGSVYFEEPNTAVLWLEIAMTVSISIFGAVVLVAQLRRLRERRRSDDRNRERLS